MNKFNFVRNSNGVIKLPPGFRFQPTDEELVFQYLRRKIFSCPMPSSSDIIPEINISKYDPWDLPFSGDMEEDRYFFTSKEARYRNGSNRANRKTSSGYWKATGSDKRIVSSTAKNVVGTRKTLVFYRGIKPPQGSNKTDWFMYEYSLHVNNVDNTTKTTTTATTTTNISPTQHASLEQTENWVLCRIFFKERSTKVVNSYNDNTDENIEQNWECDNNNNINNNVGKFGTNNYDQPRMFDLVMGRNIKTGPVPSSSSSSSSCSSSSSSSFTEVSSSYGCHDENNGYADL